MKIAHIISSSGLFGAERVLLDTCSTTSVRDIESLVIVIRNKGRAVPAIFDKALSLGISARLVTCRSKMDFRAIGDVAEAVRDFNADLIHSHNYKSNLYGQLAARKVRLPIVSTVHGWTGQDVKAELYEIFDTFILKRMTKLVAVSKPIYVRLIGMGISSNKVTYIPNCVDTDIFNPEVVSGDMRAHAAGAFTVGAVGRLSPEKGIEYLLRAAAIIRAKHPELKLVLVGDGPSRRCLEDEAEKLGLNDNAIFAGETGNVVSFYKSFDAFCMPSLTEGMPIALLEAMSMALPAVVTNVGGVPDIVSDGEAVIVPTRDEHALASSLERLINDEMARKAMGVKARQRVKDAFSKEAFADAYVSIYNEILKR